MSRQIQIRRGTSAEHENFTGAIGEVTMDTTNKTLRVHDGTTVGGNEVMSVNKFNLNLANSITKIPQDIKFELSSGTLILKAGSRCYLKTDTTLPSVLITSDLTTTQTTNGIYFAVYNGSTLSTILTTTYNYSTLPDTYSLPLAVITVSGGKITSIDKIFNGFGYIGSTLFVLPGVKGIAPNGRNTDGTLNNTVVEITTVKTINNLTSNLGYTVAITNNGLSYFLYREYSQETYPGTNYKAWYKPSENILYNTMTAQGAEQIIVGATICYFNSITGEFIPKQTFRSLDYNDTNFIVHQSMPSGKYIDLTLGASGNSYIAPADGYVYFRKDATAVGQYFVLYGSNIQVVNKSATSGGYIAGYIPVKNGETFKVEYNLAGSTVVFKFVYAQGAI